MAPNLTNPRLDNRIAAFTRDSVIEFLGLRCARDLGAPTSLENQGPGQTQEPGTQVFPDPGKHSRSQDPGYILQARGANSYLEEGPWSHSTH